MTHRRLTLLLLGLFVLLMTLNVLMNFLNIPRPGFYTSLLTMAGFSFALSHAGLRLGWGRALLLLTLVFVVSLAFESIGVATGWVYGPYYYTEKLGPKFLGLVPYLIAIAWFTMMYPAYVIADRLVGERLWGRQRLLALAALGGVVMTAWDVVMDPLMVDGGNWVWEVPGAYFGVPLQNYWGWWLTVFTTFALFLLLLGDRHYVVEKRVDRWTVVSYAVMAAGNILIAGRIGLGGPALAGLFAMLPWVVTGWQAMND